MARIVSIKHQQASFSLRAVGLLMAVILALGGGDVRMHAQTNDAALRAQVETALRQRGLPYAVAAVRSGEPWAVVDLYPLPVANGQALPTGGRVLLAYHDAAGWRLVWPDDLAYAQALVTLPDALLDPLAKQILLDSLTPAARAAGAALLDGYRLPWPGGEAAYVTQTYGDHGLGQIDFWIPSAVVVAAKAGEVVYINDSHTAHGCSTEFSRYNNVVVVRHSATEYTLYLHIATGSVSPALKNQVAAEGSAPIAQGALLARQGNIGYTCGGDGSHLHLSTAAGYFVYTNPDSLDEDNDGDFDEIVQSAWGSGHLAVDFAEAAYAQLAVWPYDTTLVSQNNRATCTEALGAGVTLFGEAGCQGVRQAFADETLLLNLPDVGWNDRIRSLLLAPGWSLRVYQHANQLGASRCLTANLPDLAGVTFEGSTIALDRAISSLQILHGAACQPARAALIGAILPATLTALGGDRLALTTTFSLTGVTGVRLSERQRAWGTGAGDVPERPDFTIAAADLVTIDVQTPAGAQVVWPDTLTIAADDVMQAWASGQTTLTLQTLFRGQDAVARPISLTLNTPVLLDTCGDVAEWNDAPAQATPLAIGESRAGVICPTGDVDFFTFPGAVGQHVSIAVEAAADGSPLDAQVTLLTEDGETEVSVDDGLGTVDALIDTILPEDGAYFIQVSPAGADSAGQAFTYTLHLRATESTLRACQPFVDAFEPDDTQAGSRALATDGQPAHFTFHQASDVDWIYFDNAVGVPFTVTATAKLQAPLVTLYAANGTTVITQAGGIDVPVVQIAWGALPLGRYFVRFTPITPDAAGCTARYSAAIVAGDFTPPTGALAIDGAAAATNILTVSLTLTAVDEASGVDAVRVANDSGLAGAAWQPAGGALAWTLATGDGDKTVFAQVRDRAGNLSALLSATIRLDSTPPAGQLSPANDTTTVVGNQAVLTVDASPDATAMRLRVGKANWGDWQPLATQTVIELPAETAPIQLDLIVRDAAGNASAPSSLTLDHYAVALFLPLANR